MTPQKTSVARSSQSLGVPRSDEPDRNMAVPLHREAFEGKHRTRAAVDLLTIQNRIRRISNGSTSLQDWLEASHLIAVSKCRCDPDGTCFCSRAVIRRQTVQKPWWSGGSQECQLIMCARHRNQGAAEREVWVV